MESDGELLEEPQRFEDKGLAVRLIYVKERDKYRVEYSPLLKNGEIEGNWGMFGGSVGYTCSEYSTEEEAREFYSKLEEIPADEILDHFAVADESLKRVELKDQYKTYYAVVNDNPPNWFHDPIVLCSEHADRNGIYRSQEKAVQERDTVREQSDNLDINVYKIHLETIGKGENP